jgi:hypothetical protein
MSARIFYMLHNDSNFHQMTVKEMYRTLLKKFAALLAGFDDVAASRAVNCQPGGTSPVKCPVAGVNFSHQLVRGQLTVSQVEDSHEKRSE